MKINNKIRYQKMDEGIGDVWAGFKDMARRSVGAAVGQHRGASYHFAGELVQNAMNDLATAIRAGQVDPSAALPASTPAAPTTPPVTPGNIPPSTPAAKKVAPGNAPAPGVTQRQTSQNINNYVQGLAKTLNAETDRNKKMALVKELVNFMADRKNYPEWQNAVKTAQYIIKKGIPDPNFSNAAINRLNAGQIMTERWQVYFINKLLEATGFTWKDLGLTLLKENKINGKYIIVETRFYKLNTLFESILEQDAPAGSGESISAYILNWIREYTKGMGQDWSQDSQVQAMAKQVQSDYARDKGKAALTKISNYIWSKAKAGQGPGGAMGATSNVSAGPDAAAGAAQPTPASSVISSSTLQQMKPDKIVNTVQSLLFRLKQVDPAMHSEIVKRIASGKSLQGLPAAGSTTGPSAS